MSLNRNYYYYYSTITATLSIHKGRTWDEVVFGSETSGGGRWTGSKDDLHAASAAHQHRGSLTSAEGADVATMSARDDYADDDVIHVITPAGHSQEGLN